MATFPRGPGLRVSSMLKASSVFMIDIVVVSGKGGGFAVVILVELSVCSILSIVFRSHEESVRIGDHIQYPMMTIKFNWDGQPR